MALLLARAEDTDVLIERHVFSLYHVLELESAATQARPLLRLLDEQLLIRSPGEDHIATVELQLWDGPPEPSSQTDDHPWEADEFCRFRIHHDQLSIWQLTSGPTAIGVDVQPGWYRMRVRSAGGSAVARAIEVYDPDEDVEENFEGILRGFETFLLQVWPAEK
ncbi:hypothetical protein [Actinomadura sp. 3N508]|uniref:hypothetical protein n=1 Tax=Actinomadura sp. 3N508 TaxID=3375153 RepID=UPI0037AF5D95